MPLAPTSPRWKLRYHTHLGVRSHDEPLFKHTLGTLDPIAHLRHAAELGFAGVSDNLARRRPEPEQQRIGDEFKRLGLQMGCLVSDTHGPLNWGARDAATREAIHQEIEAAIATAHRMGGRHILVAPARDPREPLGFALAALVANLREVEPLARRADVMLCLEHTHEARVPGRLLHHLVDAWGAVQAVHSPHVRLVFDTAHTQAMDGDLIANLRRVHDVVATVQLADNPNRNEPGTGEINFVNLLRELRALRYDGLIELEYYHSQPGAEGEARSLQAVREMDAML